MIINTLSDRWYWRVGTVDALGHDEGVWVYDDDRIEPGKLVFMRNVDKTAKGEVPKTWMFVQ